MAFFSPFAKSFRIVKAHPWLFSVLVAIELLFFCTAGVLLYKYAVSFQQSMEGFTSIINEQEWLSEPLTEENLVQLNIPATDTKGLSREYHGMIRATFLLFLELGAAFLLFHGIGTMISYHLVSGKKGRDLLRFLCAYLLCCILFFCALLLLFASTIESATDRFMLGESLGLAYGPSMFGAALLLYFFPVTTGLLGSVPLKRIPLATLKTGILRFPRIIIYYAILVFSLLFFLGLLTFYLEQIGILGCVLALLFLMTLVYGRIVLLCLFSQIGENPLTYSIRNTKKKQ